MYVMLKKTCIVIFFKGRTLDFTLDRYYKMNSDMTAMGRFLETLYLNELWSVVWSEVKNIYHLTNQV
jgi:hypothetical protein